ncbi:MAG: PQQ-dependent sugar dehydrogenase [Hyphomonadaceae bacterium]|nr:PQQ-dependent sugar dehydrogenase [Hyphomonadaceae bacterium]
MITRIAALCALVAVACCAQPAGADGDFNYAPPNADFSPAFPEQTRAPHTLSGVTLEVTEIASGLVEPWALEFLPDGSVLVTERPGRLRVITRDGVISPPVAGLPDVDARNQGGLLDVVLSPTFASDRLIYWSYAEPRGDDTNGTSVARGRLSEDASRVENAQVIFRQTPAWRSTGHYGSVLVFDRAGRLFVTLGERMGAEPRQLAQDLSTHLGKVVRINPDGSVPSDNPFAGRTEARAELWSYGHRNPQGADLHPETGALWTIEHGAKGGDELNRPLPGRNYGWPVISYGEEYSGAPIGEGVAARQGMEQPIYYWDPSFAPGDMDFYRGDLFPWRGDILVAALRSRELIRLELDGDRVVGEERFAIADGRVRDIEEAADGSLWLITDEENGRVLRVTPQR